MVTAIGLAVGALTLQTLDGESIVMDNYDERRATVLVFLSSRCRATAAVVEAINRIHEKRRQKGVLFVGLYANDAESSEDVLTFCQRQGVRFPCYRDPGGAIARRLGVEVTPGAAVLDKAGVLIYRGGFRPQEAADHIDAVLNQLVKGKPIAEAEWAATGTALGEPGAPRDVDDPYGTIAFSSELIFERIPWAPAHHCSTLAETPNGGLICVWYGGSYESADDQVLFVSRRAKGERTWSEAEVFVKGALMRPPGNAVVFRMNDQRLGLLWGRMDASRPIRRGAGWGACQPMFRYSDDSGRTWTDDQELEGLFGCLPRNAPITLQDGTFAVPLSGHAGALHGAFLLMTDDAGATWRPSGAVRRGSQPTVIERDDGSLLALLRSRPYILKSESADNGATWTEPEQTKLRCPSSGIAMRRLGNGDLVLVYNDSSIARTPLSITRSNDEGATWSKPLDLESNGGEYSYPCVIQTSDGLIHVTYTFRRYAIKHVQLNRTWLTHFDRPN